MNLEKIVAAISDIKRAFDHTKSPEGPDFWADCLNRLRDYRQSALNGTSTDPKAHITPAPIVSRPAQLAREFAATCNSRLVFMAAHSLTQFHSWSYTHESGTYWQRIHELLTSRQTNYAKANISPTFATVSNPQIVSWADERNLLTSYRFDAPPFTLEEWYEPGGFVHFDPNNRDLLKFRAANKDLNLAGFVSAKPGKYLTARYSAALTTTQIADLSAQCRVIGAPPSLLLAYTADDIERVYMTGPSSCMATNSARTDGIHPVRAYAGPDLALAYTKRMNRITARALVWPERKVASRLYGDSQTLSPLLKAEGYTIELDRDAGIYNRDAFKGARLTAIPSHTHRPAHARLEAEKVPVLIAPYCDHLSTATLSDDKLHLILSTVEENARHKLRGGYTIEAIPKERIPYRGPLMQVRYGYQGNNTSADVHPSHYGRPNP